ncbi:LacI family transcriptional regulator [Luteibacter sp. Sphag1AF]|uniref:XylR family transcriptional regulator n=1 Tax=Luteibacter sp. Sphag1AF TaxID=2587031 RepID=UPI0016077D96|nr:DNA-binding transcriptional regulator [Luteibacter sp. Sphag1AF]MBB3226021.1 LacI family transcriptional regulator [Luteibacter sp. Sphag1AF]
MAESAGVHRIALLFNANKVYDRQVIAGVGAYLASTRVTWDLFLEEDFRARLHGLSDWGGDGIIADYDDPQVAEALAGVNIPVVAVGGSYTDASRYPAALPYVATDNARLIRMGYEHLMGQGLRNFALYSLPESPASRWAQERERIFSATVSYDQMPSRIYRGHATSAAGWSEATEALIAWLRELPKPVGLVAVTDARARQVIQACMMADIAVPEEIAIVGIDSDPLARTLCRIPLTSIRQGTVQMGRTAAEWLHGMLQGQDRREARIVVPPDGIEVAASSRHQPVRSPHVMRALQYIRQYGCLGIKTEQVADYVGVSRSLLEEHFRLGLKRSVHQEILRHKIERAQAMLASGDVNYAEIAHRCGFTSVQYLYTVFRRELGCTPKAYQEKQHALARLGH